MNRGTVEATAEQVELSNGKINFLRAGDHGPAVVLLHGAMLDTAGLVWGDVLDSFAKDFTVFAPDWPNHGDSRPWSAGTGEAALTECLRQLLDHWGLGSVHLVGLSLGGAIATRFTLDHPERIAKLVVVGPAGFEEKRSYQALTNAFLRAPKITRLLSRLYARNPSWVRKSLASALVAGEQTPGFEEIVRLARHEAANKDLAANSIFDDYQVDAYGWRRMKINYLPELASLQVPTLIIRGTQDTAVAAQPLRAAASLLPNGQYLELAGAGHIAPRDVPVAFHRAVRNFLLS